MTDLRYLQVEYETPPSDGDSLRYDSSSGLWLPGGKTQIWSPSFSGSGTLAYGSPSVSYARYVEEGGWVTIWLRASGTVSGSGVEVRFSLPVAAAATSEIFNSMVLDTGSYAIPGGGYLRTTTEGAIYLPGVTNWGAGAGKIIVAPGWRYLKA